MSQLVRVLFLVCVILVLDDTLRLLPMYHNNGTVSFGFRNSEKSILLPGAEAKAGWFKKIVEKLLKKTRDRFKKGPTNKDKADALKDNIDLAKEIAQKRKAEHDRREKERREREKQRAREKALRDERRMNRLEGHRSGSDRNDRRRDRTDRDRAREKAERDRGRLEG